MGVKSYPVLFLSLLIIYVGIRLFLIVGPALISPSTVYYTLRYLFCAARDEIYLVGTKIISYNYYKDLEFIFRVGIPGSATDQWINDGSSFFDTYPCVTNTTAEDAAPPLTEPSTVDPPCGNFFLVRKQDSAIPALSLEVFGKKRQNDMFELALKSIKRRDSDLFKMTTRVNHLYEKKSNKRIANPEVSKVSTNIQPVGVKAGNKPLVTVVEVQSVRANVERKLFITAVEVQPVEVKVEKVEKETISKIVEVQSIEVKAGKEALSTTTEVKLVEVKTGGGTLTTVETHSVEVKAEKNTLSTFVEVQSAGVEVESEGPNTLRRVQPVELKVEEELQDKLEILRNETTPKLRQEKKSTKDGRSPRRARLNPKGYMFHPYRPSHQAQKSLPNYEGVTIASEKKFLLEVKKLEAEDAEDAEAEVKNAGAKTPQPGNNNPASVEDETMGEEVLMLLAPLKKGEDEDFSMEEAVSLVEEKEQGLEQGDQAMEEVPLGEVVMAHQVIQRGASVEEENDVTMGEGGAITDGGQKYNEGKDAEMSEDIEVKTTIKAVETPVVVSTAVKMEVEQTTMSVQGSAPQQAPIMVITTTSGYNKPAEATHPTNTAKPTEVPEKLLPTQKSPFPEEKKAMGEPPRPKRKLGGSRLTQASASSAAATTTTTPVVPKPEEEEEKWGDDDEVEDFSNFPDGTTLSEDQLAQSTAMGTYVVEKKSGDMECDRRIALRNVSQEGKRTRQRRS